LHVILACGFEVEVDAASPSLETAQPPLYQITDPNNVCAKVSAKVRVKVCAKVRAKVCANCEFL